MLDQRSISCADFIGQDVPFLDTMQTCRETTLNWRANYLILLASPTYRRPRSGLGTWTAKIQRADHEHYLERVLGEADDAGEADGERILTFPQAQEAARAAASDYRRSAGIDGGPLTVTKAAEHYLAVFTGKDISTQRRIIDTCLIPWFGDRVMHDVRAPEIAARLAAHAKSPARVRTSRLAKAPKFKAAPETDDQHRARKASVNRMRSVFLAVAARCFKDGLLHDDREWRRVEKFKGVDQARDRFPTQEELVRLQNAAGPHFRRLIHGALFTGCRLGELAGLRVEDVHVDQGQIYVTAGQAKSKKSRYVDLPPDGVALFAELVAGRPADALVFTRQDGSAWRKNLHQRDLVRANAAANISPPLTFHHLRHAYASHLLRNGARIEYVSELLGHSSIAVTRKHYAHLTREDLKKAAALLPSFGFTPANKVVALEPKPAKRRAAGE